MSDSEQIRIRVGQPLKAKWDGMLTARKITQQAAVTALIDWITCEDPLTQTMIFGQVPVQDRADLTRLVLKRLAGSARKPPRKSS